MKTTLLLSLIPFICALASTEVTRESMMLAQQVRRAIQLYLLNNGGRMPERWEHIKKSYSSEYVNRQLNQFTAFQSYSLEDHYQFVTQLMPYIEGGHVEDGSQVLLIRTVPLEGGAQLNPEIKNQKRWRYIIYKDSNGNILSSRASESDVKIMLDKSGVRLNRIPGLPEVETESLLPDKEKTHFVNSEEQEFLLQNPQFDPSRNSSEVRSIAKERSVDDTSPTDKSYLHIFVIILLCVAIIAIWWFWPKKAK